MCFSWDVNQNRRELKENLRGSISRMKEYCDGKRREETFKEGDMVYLKLCPHPQQSVSLKALYKLGSRYYGPFRAVARIGEVVYRLELPRDAQIHRVIHVSQLKRRVGLEIDVSNILPVVNTVGNIVIRPEQVLEYRQVKKGGRLRWEVLIQW